MAGRLGELKFDYTKREWTLDDYTIRPTPDGQFSVEIDQRQAHCSPTLGAAESWIRKQRRVNRRKVSLLLLDDNGNEAVFSGFHSGSGSPIIGGEQKSFSGRSYYADSPETREALTALKVARENLRTVEKELEHFQMRFPRVMSKDTEDINEAVISAEERYDLAKRGEAPRRGMRDAW